jgi:hypothetical protein
MRLKRNLCWILTLRILGKNNITHICMHTNITQYYTNTNTERELEIRMFFSSAKVHVNLGSSLKNKVPAESNEYYGESGEAYGNDEEYYRDIDDDEDFKDKKSASHTTLTIEHGTVGPKIVVGIPFGPSDDSSKEIAGKELE